MSGETPRDAPFGSSPGPSNATDAERASQPPRISDQAPGAGDGASLLKPVPSVPRPTARKPTFPGTEVSPLAVSGSSPPATKAPDVPSFDAFDGAAEPPPLFQIESSATTTGALTPKPTAAGASAADASARRRSRRTVKIPDDAVPAKSPSSTRPPAPDDIEDRDTLLETAARGSGEAPFALDIPPASAPQLDPSDIIETSDFGAPAPMAPFMPASGPFMPASGPFMPASAPSPAPPIPIVSMDPLPAPSPMPDFASSSSESEVIRPMRIISIESSDDTVEVSQRTSILPPEADLSAPRSPEEEITPPAPPPADAIAAPQAAPSSPTELEAEELEAVEEDEPITQPSQALVTGLRTEESDSVEEIDVDRISDVGATLAEASPQPKKPPPPPPKRAPSDAAPPSRPPTSTSTPAAAAPAAPAADKPQAAADPNKKRQKSWWDELFGDDFMRTMDHLDAKVIKRECDFIEDRLGLERGAVMLDLACGPGSHAVELASRGYSVVGYDLSLAMLARAADEAQERGQKLNFLQGDMREMAFEETFDGVYCWSTSFGYFDDEKNLNVLTRIRRALRKGGMLLLDLTNRDYVAPRQPSLVWFEGDGCVCMDEMFLDSFSSRLRVKRTVMFEDGRSKEVDYSIRLYALHELGKMLHETGFKVVEVTGHPAHPGVFFGSESPRVIVLAERSD